MTKKTEEKTAEETAVKHKPVEISAEEYDRRINLSVADKEYINPSLDFYKKGK